MTSKSFITRLQNDNGSFHELFHRHHGNPILTAQDWPYPIHSVFNPGATVFQGEVLLLVRAEDRRGFSHLTVARSKNGIDGWHIDSEPTLFPTVHQNPEELWGIEDPRITWMEDLEKWAITYTAFSQRGPVVSLALTEDFRNFVKIGPISGIDDKDAALFPRKINDKWVLLHRPIVKDSSIPGAHIWISYAEDLQSWTSQEILLHARAGGWWDSGKIGLSTPPLETSDGWLILYHGVRQTASGAIYRLGLALLDLENPSLVLHRSDEWIFGPEEAYERFGDVGDVVFPCGWLLDEASETIRIYYGGADTCVALATANLPEVLAYLHRCPGQHMNDIYQ